MRQFTVIAAPAFMADVRHTCAEDTRVWGTHAATFWPDLRHVEVTLVWGTHSATFG